MSNFCHRRAGITLMEVLIAVGILAVGLSSVVALLPAGHSMAQRSFVEDQASIVAANAVADFVTQGYLRPASLSDLSPLVVNAPALFDPLYDPANPASTPAWPAAFSILRLKTDGVLALGAANSFRSSQPINGYLVRGQDDLVYTIPENTNLDVTNRFRQGRREFQGKFTWAALLARADGTVGTLLPGDRALLTIIVFHQREPATPSITQPVGTYANGLFTWTTDLVPSRKDNDVLRTGACMLLTPSSGGPVSIRRLSLASITSIDSSNRDALVDFDGGDPPGTPPYNAFILPDAVAILEKVVTMESAHGYAP